MPTKKVTWENLYVVPTVRKAGIGSMLVEEGLSLVRQKGYLYMMGCVNAIDKEGFVSYLERFGFKKGHEMIWIDISM